jgi:hypothetical protein
MRIDLLSFLAAAIVAAGLSAQTSHYSPSGHTTLEGGSNNTIPWWAGSGTYQQIHDASEMTISLGGASANIDQIGFRKDGLLAGTVPGRTLDIQIDLGHTSVTAAGITTTFLTNLGTSTNVLPYTTVNLPTLSNSGLPNPEGWSFPFTAFAYSATAGNLCWEFRFRNSNTTASAPLDAASVSSATFFALIGGGCIATGQTLPATIGLRSLSTTTGAYRNRLDRGPASAPAAFFIGVTPTPIGLPGMCAPLEFLPLVNVAGGTTATGQWDLTLTFGSLVGLPPVSLYGQFLFLDANLPLSLGVSSANHLTLPPPSVTHVSRAWFGAASSGQGNETALTGSIGISYGLVTIFRKP